MATMVPDVDDNIRERRNCPLPTAHCPLVLGLPDDAFEQRRPHRGLITKFEVRMAVLGRLGIGPGEVLWDVGAGSGSVSIEAARLCPGLRVYAVERAAEDVAIVRRNVARFAPEVAVVAGEAPEALADLPDPDAVFIGGSGGRLEAILAYVIERLHPGGRLVLTAATVETLAAATAALRARRASGWTTELSLIQVARARDLARLTAFEGLNPVFVLAARRGRTED